jgi:hypothetical protein
MNKEEEPAILIVESTDRDKEFQYLKELAERTLLNIYKLPPEMLNPPNSLDFIDPNELIGKDLIVPIKPKKNWVDLKGTKNQRKRRRKKDRGKKWTK